jgi:hypothetical protein
VFDDFVAIPSDRARVQVAFHGRVAEIEQDAVVSESASVEITHEIKDDVALRRFRGNARCR